MLQVSPSVPVAGLVAGRPARKLLYGYGYRRRGHSTPHTACRKCSVLVVHVMGGAADAGLHDVDIGAAIMRHARIARGPLCRCGTDAACDGDARGWAAGDPTVAAAS